MADHEFVATTATPSPRSTTCSTPGTSSAAAGSKRFIAPPWYGFRLSAANFIPGRRTSMENSAVPVALGIWSSRGWLLPR